MRKLLIVFTFFVGLMMLNSVLAEDQVILPTLPAVLLLPETVYSPVLTPANLKENQAFIFSRGGTVEEWEEEFKLKGILLKAYDDSNNRVLLITGLADEDGQRYGDIDIQSPATRSEYRSLYQKGSPFEAKGYRSESAEWKNFKNIGRFLMLRYSYRENGEILYRGFARLSVKNGLSIKVDMQVYGRALSAGDNTALNKVFDSISFTGNVGEGAKTIPVFINESTSAPSETNKPEFTMKGMTRANAKLTATVMSFTSNTPSNFSTVADAKGSYSFPIMLSGEGIYMMNLTVEAEGLDPMEKTYSITYGRNLLPISITSGLPNVLIQDKYAITGKTEPGVTVQMILNDDNVTKPSNSKGEFSFNIRTKAEGVYQLRLSFEKKGYDSRMFDFTGIKGPAAQTQESPGGLTAAATFPGETNAASSQGDALSPGYTELIAKSETYMGKLLTYDGFITNIEEGNNGFILSIALRKAVNGYADSIKVMMDKEPGFAKDDKVRVYGLLENMAMDSNQSLDLNYPTLRVQSIHLLEQALNPDT